MLRRLSFFLLMFFPACLFAQSVLLRQTNLSKWDIRTANYSGITALGGERYALVSDKEPADGFFIFTIRQDSLTGKVTHVALEDFRANPMPTLDARGRSTRDCEGIAWFAPAGTLFVSGEGDQRILEYDTLGVPTGRELLVPEQFGNKRIVGNYGFESLTYCATTARFWTTTEATLPADGDCVSAKSPEVQNLLRLQSFGADLQPREQYAYRMDGAKTKKFGRVYAMGVVALTALPDGSLLVMEREANVRANYLGSKARCKIFRVVPDAVCAVRSDERLADLPEERFLKKEPVATFATRISPFKLSFANYEGICPGCKLADGRQTFLLINDSQASFGRRRLHLKDYVKVLIIEMP